MFSEGYLIRVLLKKSNFFGRDYSKIWILHMSLLWETKSEDRKLLGNKKLKKFLKILKRKVDIFIWIKNIFNPKIFTSINGLWFYYMN